MQTWDDALRDGLAGALRELVEREGSWREEARGSSMVPTILDGAVVEVRPLPAALAIDELVAFVPLERKGIAVHRVVEVREDGAARLRGDAMPQDDGWIARDRQIGVVRRYWLGGRCYEARPGRPRARPSRLRYQLQRAVRAARRLRGLRL